MVALSKRQPIINFCVPNLKLDDWDEVPKDLIFHHDDLEFSCSFCRKDGIQIIATVRNPTTIHVTIASIQSMRPGINENELLEVAPEIIKLFFGDVKYKLQPNHPRYPHPKHYYLQIENYDENFAD